MNRSTNSSQPRRFWRVILYLALASMAALLAACAGPTPGAPEADNQPAGEAPLEESSPDVDPTPAECLTDAHGCAMIPPGETVKIGMAGPMSGPYEAYGRDISQAGQLAIEDLGSYMGWSFELALGDTLGDPELAVPWAQTWIDDPTVVAIAGHIFSGETQATIPMYEAAGLPMMSPSATNPDLTSIGSPVFNRVTFTDVVQAENAALRLWAYLNVQTLAVLDDGDSYGMALAEMTASEYEKLGGQVVYAATIPEGQEALQAMIEEIAALDVDAIYYGGYETAAGSVMVELDRLASEALLAEETDGEEEPVEGETETPYDILFFGGDGIYGENFLAIAGNHRGGVIAATVFPPETDVRSTFDERYLGVYGVEAGTLSPFSWHGYDAVGTLIYAVKRVAIVGLDGNLYIPRRALVDEVRGLENYTGASGSITCSEVGECSTSIPLFHRVEEGAWVPAF